MSAPARPTRDRLRDRVWPAVLLALLLTLPFLGKDSTLDEETHRFIARFLRDQPLRPFDWVRPFQPFANPAPGDYFLHPHPPGWHYVLAAWTAVAGDTVAPHTRLLGPLLLAACTVATFGLARAVGAPAGAAALLLATSPVAVLAAHDSFMLDLPLMVLVALAAWAAAEAGAARSPALAALAGALVSLAALVKYPALLAVPGVVALVAARASAGPPEGAAETRRPATGHPPRPGPSARLAGITALAAALPFTAFQAWTAATYGHPHLAYVAGRSADIATSPGWVRLAATLSAAGAVAVAPGLGAWLALRRPGPGRSLSSALSAVASLGTLAASGLLARDPAALRGAPAPSPIALVAATVLATLGAALLVGVAREARDRVGLALAAVALPVVLGQAAGLSFASARYLAPAIPVLAVVVGRAGLAGRGLRAAAAAQISLSLALGVADHALSGTWTEAAGRIARDHPAGPGGARWVCAEWGLRDALEARGFRAVPPDALPGSAAGEPERPRPGDLVVFSRVSPADPACDALALRAVREIRFESPFPVRVMDREGFGGFYGDFWGALPFTFSRGPVEVVGVYRVAAP